MKQPLIAKLVLEDGSIFTGISFGAKGTTQGEVVFNTSMTGYQEILTDPSYHGQIVTMTYPLIGNYGVAADDGESKRVQAAGFIVKEPASCYSNFRAHQSLQDYLVENNIVAIADIDTRALVRKLRIKGAMNGLLTTEILDDHQLIEQVKQVPALVGRDLVCDVTIPASEPWQHGYQSAFAGPINWHHPANQDKKPLVAAFDCGMKHNICRNLVEAGFEVVTVPAKASYEEIMSYNPAGVFVSNGPGDPEPVNYTIDTIKKLIKDEIPMFGICLGLELIGLALGGKIYKMKFGHRGGNQPVKNLDTSRVEITAQNHGFALDINSFNRDDVRITHINLNDQSLEGIAHKKQPLFAVQYHPEASPGPHDATYLFNAFYDMVKTRMPVEMLAT